MEHVDEYDDAMIAAMDLIWGEGFMAPGGEGNVDNMVKGIDLQGKNVRKEYELISTGLRDDITALLGK